MAHTREPGQPSRAPSGPRGGLARLGRLAARHPWPILAVAAVFLVLAGLAGRVPGAQVVAICGRSPQAGLAARTGVA